MDFRLTKEQETFRQEIRDFLKRELPSDWKKRAGIEDGSDDVWAFSRSLVRKLGERGWLTMSWPKEYGGQERSPIENLIFSEEMAYHRAPGAGSIGVTIVGPIIMLFGSPKQKNEYLPRLASGEIDFCLGYSEPGAGSDLASLRLRAVEDGNEFVLNGQKTFTSLAHRDPYCWLTARTNVDVPKHKGISLFIVDMNTPGITVRPLVNMAGVHSFNDVFFDDVRVPRDCLVGEKNGGWYHLAAALDLERSPSFSFFPLAALRPDFEDLVEYARGATRNGRPLAAIPAVRQKLAEMAIELEVGRLLCYRVAWMLGQGVIPNYEASMVKHYSTELAQKLANLGMETLGLYGQLKNGSKWAPLGGRIEHAYLNSVSATIGAGTSEIQRNVIATRGLGLPRG